MNLVRNKKGFTLTELLVVIAILGVILVIAIPSFIFINNMTKKKMLETKVEIIEEAAILFGESIKKTVVKSSSMYNENLPCKSVNIGYLVPRYLNKDNENECLSEESNNGVGCVVDPSDETNYLDDKEVIIYYKNKRIYAVVDVDDELVCKNEENVELKMSSFYLEQNDLVYTTDTEVTAYLSWDNPNVKYYCVTNTQGSSNCEWKAVNGTIVTSEHTLTDGDGTKIVYAYLKDNAGNVSSEVYDTILLDTTAPTENIVRINSSDNNTSSTSVTLSLSSIGANEMCISNTTSCNDWEDYATSKNWSLTSGEGTKSVYVWYRDEYGNTTNYVTDTINLDSSAPTNNAVKINSNEEFTTNTSVTLSLSSIGANEMCISNTTSCNDWEDYITSKNWELSSGDGTKTVYVWYRDEYGNTTDSITDVITLDTSIPTVTASAVDNNTTVPKITFMSTETGTYCINKSSTRTNMSNCVESANVTKNTSISTDVLATNTYYVHIKDSAGNIGVSSAVSINKVFCVSGTTLSTCLINSDVSGLQKKYIGSDIMYRFAGTNGNLGINNYICLGTSSKCSSGSDNMYRIIGVEPATGYIKVIKQKYLPTKTEWSKTTTVWLNSDAYLHVYSWYNNLSFKNIIQSHSWGIGTIGMNTSDSLTRVQVLSKENASTINAYVGIISLSDYYMAYNSNSALRAFYINQSYNWIMGGNNQKLEEYIDEYTMSKNATNSIYHMSNSNGAGWMVIGPDGEQLLDWSYNVRPTFYLKSTVKYLSGTGTSSDPFIIN